MVIGTSQMVDSAEVTSRILKWLQIKPQAIDVILFISRLRWISKYQVSRDNLSGSCEPDRLGFTSKVTSKSKL